MDVAAVCTFVDIKLDTLHAVLPSQTKCAQHSKHREVAHALCQLTSPFQGNLNSTGAQNTAQC